MTNFRLLISVLATLLIASHLWGHGSPINISVEAGRLVASHPSDQIFAPPIFGQTDDFDDFADADFFPTLGNVLLWEVPGLEIHDMGDSASLALEVLARPVIGSSPAEHRVLWYWNPDTEAVEESPVEFHLLATGPSSLSINPEDQLSPAPFMLADPVADQTGFHNHTLLLYALDDDNTAPAGVYGVFARFTSNSYAPSDPLLILFNYFTENELLPENSLAIYEAATLPGDFDLDDDVDGRDFLEWQRLIGSTTRSVADASLNGVVDAADLQIWQQNYGNTFEESFFLPVTYVPEPECLMTLIQALAICGSLFRQSK
ncbi:hypothetical protein [Bythopirellula goksoeyrii]|uniref:Uncharacterized protein n=1 Tax=Bythopirellula goksoeyrii TaxID=1400387 RepID=A0A5B9QAC1_9BACT|nr:hypothetical protein [Bythopirellula goksoeyrii]QEG33836.1 hypothetical protein Pr1d_11060 [Bythopirellula goksoeyrii]